MAFTVTGYVDGVLYGLHADPNTLAGDNGIVVTCAPTDALDLVRIATDRGEQIDVTATGPLVTASLTDPVGLVAALQEYTEVIAVDGDAPEMVSEEDMDPSVQY